MLRFKLRTYPIYYQASLCIEVFNKPQNCNNTTHSLHVHVHMQLDKLWHGLKFGNFWKTFSSHAKGFFCCVKNVFASIESLWQLLNHRRNCVYFKCAIFICSLLWFFFCVPLESQNDVKNRRLFVKRVGNKRNNVAKNAAGLFMFTNGANESTINRSFY